MNVVIVTGASAEEVAALVFAVQERQKSNPERKTQENERESLIRQYEQRLAKLKAGASPGNVAV